MSLIKPKCKVCEEGVHISECRDDGYYCNNCDDPASGEKAPRVRVDSWDDIDIWDEVNEYQDIGGSTCVLFMGAISLVAIIILAFT